jgi:UDP-glucose 4-epimerase
MGEGEQTRTFTHGKDAAQGYKLCTKNKNAINETFNLSGNEEVKIIQVLEIIWNMTRKGEKLKIKHLPFLPYDTKRRFLSNKKLQEKLNWKPIIGLKEGLFETVESLRKVTDTHHSQL